MRRGHSNDLDCALEPLRGVLKLLHVGGEHGQVEEDFLVVRFEPHQTQKPDEIRAHWSCHKTTMTSRS